MEIPKDFGNEKESGHFALYADYEPEGLLTSGQIICIIARLLMAMNPGLGKTSWQTAYIATKIALHNKNDDRLSLRTILVLSLLHLSGFFHFNGESPVENKNFTSEENYRAYTYTYYYLKEMTPVSENAQTILFYNQVYDSKVAEKLIDMKYASLIFLSQSLCKMIASKGKSYDERDFSAYGLSKYNHDYLDVFRTIDKSRGISGAIENGAYEAELFKWFSNLQFNKEDTKILLRLLIYVMDFKSTQTVQHTIHAASYAVVVGKYAKCTRQELNELFTAGILHDLGKMAIPVAILDSPQKHLPNWQYTVIKQHVVETEKILEGCVPPKIFYIAVRHHEKLDGSGYPNHLSASDLTDQQRMMTVADILSALVDKRSYKESYDKMHIQAIMKENVEDGKIDGRFCKCILENYESVQTDCMIIETNLRAPLGLVEIQFQEEMSNIQAI